MNNKFCVIPWSHLQVDPNGDVRPCCISQPIEGSVVGNIQNSTLDELWNSPRMMQLRSNILSGKGDRICSVCYEYDDAGMKSVRQSANNWMSLQFDGVQDALSQTNASGHCAKVNLEYWDFRFSNMCNYKCRTCGPEYSSLWNADAKKLGWWGNTQTKPITWMKKVEDRIDVMEKHVDRVKEIYFAGGEPLIMEEHFRTLDMLIKHNRTDVKLRYNTNLSTLKYKSFDILEDYWSKFKSVEISGSLDAIGKRAEYIRSGTKWDVVDANIRRLVEASNRGKLTLNFNVTVSNLNAFYLDEIVHYLIDVGAIQNPRTYTSKPWQFHFNLVFYPEHYSIKNMPETAKAALIEKFDTFDQAFKEKYGVSYSFFDELYSIIYEESNPNMMERFRNTTFDLDQLRQESIAEVLPELWGHYG